MVLAGLEVPDGSAQGADHLRGQKALCPSLSLAPSGIPCCQRKLARLPLRPLKLNFEGRLSQRSRATSSRRIRAATGQSRQRAITDERRHLDDLAVTPIGRFAQLPVLPAFAAVDMGIFRLFRARSGVTSRILPCLLAASYTTLPITRKNGSHSLHFERWNLPQLILLGAWIVQAIRIFYGLDFNDEMQYYGELQSLLESNKLFTSDLFLQQTVYILVYPILKVYYVLFGASSIIVFSRFLLSLFLMTIYGISRRALMRAGVGPTAAAASSFAITLAVPLYNIYAISYNTVALGLLALSFTAMLDWKQRVTVRTLAGHATLVALLLLVYAPLGAGIASVLLARYAIDNGFNSAFRFSRYATSFVAATLALVAMFSTFDDAAVALRFTSAFNIGQNASDTIRFLAMLVAVSAAARLLAKYVDPKSPQLAVNPMLVVTLLSATLVAVLAGITEAVIGNVWTAVSYVTVLCAATFALTVRGDMMARRNWVFVLLLMSAGIMGGISSNGIKQAHGVAMMATPIIVAISTSRPYDGPSSRIIGGLGAVIIFGILSVWVCVWLANPYRDEYLWSSQSSISSAPAFRHIRVSALKSSAAAEIRDLLAEVPPGARLLIIGAHPWIYMVLNAKPDSDMIFMHLTGRDAAYELLASRLSARRPDYILIAGPSAPKVLAATSALITRRGLHCVAKVTSPVLRSANATIRTYQQVLPEITLCGPGIAPPSRP